MENTKKIDKQTAVGFNVRVIAQTGILSGIAFLLTTFEIPLWFIPGFYKLDVSELPVLIGSFAMGPVAGIAIDFIKEILYFLLHGSSTAGVGELANLIIDCSLILTASCFYKRRKTKKNAAVGMIFGTLLMTVVGSVMNIYLLLPLYAGAFHLPLSTIIQMGTKLNASITDLNTFVLFAVAPFNLLKGTLVSCLTFLIYKKVSPILHGKIGRT